MTNVDTPPVATAPIESLPPPVKPRSNLGLVGLALGIPVISGTLLCFVTSLPAALTINLATVVVTAALVAFDAYRLGKVDFQGRQREGAVLLFVGMCLLWLIVYPVAFFRRNAFVSPQLGFVAVVVAAFFVAAPFASSLIRRAGLPACTSTEVVQVLDSVIRQSPVGESLVSIDGHREVRYDRDAKVRYGECIVHTSSGKIPVKFIVEWRERSKGLFQVRLSDPELPLCTSAAVAKILEQFIRQSQVGATLKSIDGYREVSYDREAGLRYGECTAHTDAGDVPLKFIVEWQDRAEGRYQVRLPQQDLPPCAGAQVVQVLEQVIRTTSLGANLKFVDGHREVRHDRDAEMRYGECTAHTDAGDVLVKFVVYWTDRENGKFMVRLSEPELPLCSSVEVARVLEQVIRKTLNGATLKSVDGHREVRYDRDSNVRHGECVAHTDAEDVPVRFIVKWQNREQGVFNVQIVGSTD